MTTRTLTPATAAQIKLALWQGETQVSIAARFGCSQATVSSISIGRSYEYVPWPDGSFDPPAKRDKKARAAGILTPTVLEARSAISPIAPSEDTAAERLAKRMTSVEEGVESAKKAKVEILELSDLVKEQMDAAADEEVRAVVSSVQSLNSAEYLASLEPPTDEGTLVTAEMMAWEDVQAIAGLRNPYMARAKEDKAFRHALCIVFKHTAPNDWAAPHIYPLIIGTMKMIGYSIEEEIK